MAELTITTVVSSIKEIADAIERLRNPSDIDLLKLSKAGLYKQGACYVRHTRGNCKHYVISAPAIRTYKLQSTVLMFSTMLHWLTHKVAEGQNAAHFPCSKSLIYWKRQLLSRNINFWPSVTLCVSQWSMIIIIIKSL
jgi:hypothetical protein